MKYILYTSLSVLCILSSHAQTNEPWGPFTIPTIDLNDEKSMLVVVDQEKGQYLGHPTTVLLDDKKTIICVYPKGHGRGAIVYKRSKDGGLTWSERLPTPESWATSKRAPIIYPMYDQNGKKRIILFTGGTPIRHAISEDEGETWSELKELVEWGGIVCFSCVEQLRTSTGKIKPGHYIAMYHRGGRVFQLFKTFTKDGGLTWSDPEVVYKNGDIRLCEPGIIRSPDGKQLAVLLRENARNKNSYIIFSDNEGKTWTEPRELPPSLAGDRHVLKYAPDGRLFITFRDRPPTTWVSPTSGDWVGWVGTYQDLVEGNEGQYRIRFKDNFHKWDCAYPGLELLPDGTFVTTTYGKWEKGKPHYVISRRFKLDELEKFAKKKKLYMNYPDTK